MKEESKKILVIEDEPNIVMGLKDGLEFEGFSVISTSYGEEGIKLLRQERPNCVILDLMLPDMNGYVTCETIRKIDPIIPIIILSARSQEVDIVRGLEAGADDYVTKPFSIAELIARIRAIFRRLEKSHPNFDREIKIGTAVINLKNHTLKKGKKEYNLSFYEIELLKLLYEKMGQPVSREEILNKIWGLESTPYNRTVDNFIVKLRKKIEDKPEKPKYILTVHGYGYKMVI